MKAGKRVRGLGLGIMVLAVAVCYPTCARAEVFAPKDNAFGAFDAPGMNRLVIVDYYLGAVMEALASNQCEVITYIQCEFIACLTGYCPLQFYSSDPVARIEQLLKNSEDFRAIEYEWERIWANEHPAQPTPERVGGPIQ